MIDDNVHPQNSVRLIDALVDANKQFEMFLYPGRRHGVWSSQYSRLSYDFILEHMAPERTISNFESPAEESGADESPPETDADRSPVGPYSTVKSGS
jgi:dipeptidyl-peptidase-4